MQALARLCQDGCAWIGLNQHTGALAPTRLSTALAIGRRDCSTPQLHKHFQLKDEKLNY